MANFFERFVSEADKRRKQIADLGSRAYDTINTGDGGRSWSQRTPTNPNQSAVAGTAGFVNRNVVKPAVTAGQKSLNTVATLDAGIKGLAGVGARTLFGDTAGANRAIINTQRVMDDKLTNGFGGKGGFLTPQQARSRGNGLTGIREDFIKPTLQASSEVAPFVPVGGALFKGASVGGKIASRALGEGIANAGVSGITDAANQYAQKGNVNLGQTAKAAAVGGTIAAALPVAGAAVRNSAPIARQGIQRTSQAVQAADKRAFTPRISIDEQNALRDFSDALVGANKAQGRELSDTIGRAQEIGRKYGIDLTTGSVASRLERSNSVLDQIGKKNRTVSQGGYVKVPGEPEAPFPIKQIIDAKQVNQTTGRATLPTSAPAGKTTKVSLNTERLDLPESGKRQLDADTAETINRLSNDEVMRAAKSAGIDTKSYTPAKTRQKIAEQLNLRRDTVRLQNEAEAARKAGDIERAAQLLKESAEAGRTSRTQGTDIARQLQARKIIANELDTPPQKIFKLLDNAGVDPDVYSRRFANVDFNNSDEVVKAYRELVPPKAGDWIDVIRYNSMLSSPLTHIVNIGSNALNIGVVAPIEKTLRGIADATGGLFGKERRFAPGEGAAYASSASRSIKEAANNFLDAMRTGENQTPDISDISTPLAVGGAKGAAYQTLSFPMKLLGASDKFFRTIAEAGEEGALTAREKAGIKLGGNRQALKEAEGSYRLYQQDTTLDGQGAILKTIDQVANAIQTLRSKNRVFGFVFPFVKTPTNILKQGVEFSPLGFANLKGVDDKLTAITRASIGTAVFGAAAAMLSSGDLTWAEPINPEEKARWRSEGKQPYSMRINGANVNFSKLPPGVAFPFALTAAIDDAINNKKMDTKTADAIMQGVAKWGQFLGDQSYLKQIGDTLALVKGDPEKAVQAVSNYPQQLIPFRALTGWVARMTDDTERKINTDKSYIDKQVQSLMLNYPGLRQQVETRNYRGEPIPANNPVLNSFIPFKVTDDRGVNPIDAQLDAAKKATEKNPLLNDAQNKEVQKRAAGSITQAQQDFLNSDIYKTLSPADQKRGLEAIKSDFTEVESRKYQAETNSGVYAQGYKGEVKAPSNRVSAIMNGNFDPTSYGTKGDSSNRTVLKDDTRGTALLDKVGTMNSTQQKEWQSGKFDEKFADIIDRANQIKTDGMPPIPKTNTALKAYADYLKVKEGKPSQLKLNDAKKDFLKSAYTSSLSENARELYSTNYSTDDKINALLSGSITPSEFEQALQIDNQLISWGLQATPKISNTIRREFGYDDAPSKSGSRGGGSKLSPSDFKLPDFITQYGIQGANLAASARLK